VKRHLRSKAAPTARTLQATSSGIDKKQLKKQARGIGISAASAYIMSLLQMGLLYLMSTSRVKAYVMNMFMDKVNGEAKRTLHEYGVTSTVEDVMGTRMSRIRKKMLKLLKSVGKIQKLLDKIPSMPDIPGLPAGIPGMGKAKDKVTNVMDKVGGKQKAFMGKLFK
jgi:hypothetical protein